MGMTNSYTKKPTDTSMSIRFHKNMLKKAKKYNLNISAIARDSVYKHIANIEYRRKKLNEGI